MSKVNVDTIEPQSASTLTLGAPGDTVTIPSGATIDASAGAATGFGKVLQVAQITMNSTASTTSTSFVASGLIAPFSSLASTSSKIFITLSGGNTSSSSSEVHTTLYAQIGAGAYADIAPSDFFGLWKGPSDSHKTTHSVNYLYSPGAVSAVNIQPYYKANSGTAYFNEATVHVNLIIMEIGA